MKLYSCLLASLWPLLNSCAQPSTGTKPLTIGDTIPHIIITDVINFPVSKIQLSSYKGKLLIIDFWATWCSSCVKTFPKLDTLQQKFSKQLQFVLVNHLIHSGNTTQQVKSFFTTRKNLTTHLRRIPVCTDTTVRLRQLFPHTFIPHYVWVGPAGTIIAITGSEAVTPANIRAAIRGKPLSVPLKTQ